MSSLEHTEPVPVDPELKRLDGAVREAYVPALAPPVTYGSLADIPFDNAIAGTRRGRPQPQAQGYGHGCGEGRGRRRAQGRAQGRGQERG